MQSKLKEKKKKRQFPQFYQNDLVLWQVWDFATFSHRLIFMVLFYSQSNTANFFFFFLLKNIQQEMLLT